MPDLFTPLAFSNSLRLVSTKPCFQKTGSAFSSTPSRLKFLVRPIGILLRIEPLGSISSRDRRPGSLYNEPCGSVRASDGRTKNLTVRAERGHRDAKRRIILREHPQSPA